MNHYPSNHCYSNSFNDNQQRDYIINIQGKTSTNKNLFSKKRTESFSDVYQTVDINSTRSSQIIKYDNWKGIIERRSKNLRISNPDSEYENKKTDVFNRDKTKQSSSKSVIEQNQMFTEYVKFLGKNKLIGKKPNTREALLSDRVHDKPKHFAINLNSQRYNNNSHMKTKSLFTDNLEKICTNYNTLNTQNIPLIEDNENSLFLMKKDRIEDTSKLINFVANNIGSKNGSSGRDLFTRKYMIE